MKPIYFIFIIVFAHNAANSQNRKRNFRQTEIGLFFGGAYYIGDMNPNGHFKSSRPSVGFFMRYTTNYRYAFRAGMNFGSVMGDDSQSNNPDQIERNLNFKSQIFEFNTLAEFNFLEYRISNNKYNITSFLFLGLNVFRFNPTTVYQGLTYELRPLKTEGQSKPYKLTQIGIPFGIGFKVNVSNNVGLGLEWGPRKTFTDYLDDVSGVYPNTNSNPFNTQIAQILSDRSKNAGSNINEQRGNPKSKDWYFFFGVTLNIKVNFKPEPCYEYGLRK
jgi:hypothetical protein